MGTIVIVFGLPFFSVANISLYSKITDEKTQGEWISLNSKMDRRLAASSLIRGMLFNDG